MNSPGNGPSILAWACGAQHKFMVLFRGLIIVEKAGLAKSLPGFITVDSDPPS